jgi:type IV pilus assembly protein PilV
MQTSLRFFSKGMTLIEVLISLVILAIGMLGIASMLLLSNKANNSSYTKQLAVQSVYDIFDKIRANYSAAVNGNYTVNNISNNPTIPAQPSTLCDTSPCNPAQLATYDIWYWLAKDVAKLPNGSGSITTALSGVAGNTIITVTVQWNDSPAQNAVGSIAPLGTSSGFVQLIVQSQI